MRPTRRTESKKREWHPPSGFGVRLKALREKAEINPYRLSELCRVDRTVVVLIEAGRIQTPKIDVALRLARALGTTPEYLQEGKGEGPTAEHVLEAYEALLAGGAEG